MIGFEEKNLCCCQGYDLGEGISHLKTDSKYIHIWSKRYPTIFENFHAVYIKEGIVPLLFCTCNWQWRCTALTFAYQIEPKPTQRWHKSIF